MNDSNPFLTDEWKHLPRTTREVRFEADGMPWTNRRDPVMREGIIDVYHKLCAMDETGLLVHGHDRSRERSQVGPPR